IGTSTSAVLAYRNPSCEIKVVDVNGDRISRWNSSNPPIFEPAGAEDIEDGPRAPNLTFSVDIAGAIAEADVVFICVDTPAHVNLSSVDHFDMDLTRHDGALRMIVESSVGHTVVVEKSTVPGGTSQRSADFLASYTTPEKSFTVLSNPEYLAQGTSINDIMYPDRVIIGYTQDDPAAKAASEALANLYIPWVPPNRVLTMSLFSSELTKLAHNAFLAQRVSSINALSAICEASGGDIADVSRGLGMNARIGSKYLRASFGFGGSCLVKDTASLAYLARSLGLAEPSDYWKHVLLLNEYQKARVAERIVTQLGGAPLLHQERIAVLGFAYKKETRDTRGTPARDVVLQLLKSGASVALYDPYASVTQIQTELGGQSSDPLVSATLQDHLTVSPSVYDACRDARAVVVLNEIPELDNGNAPAESMREPRYVFDGKGFLDSRGLEQQGFIVEVVGR
ncbi:nucleotide sugar dehydrogenase, partial [Aspergillus campestris IBT 28561]